MRAYILDSENDVFGRLNELPYSGIYINVGLESPHQTTLDLLGKPQSSHDVQKAFEKLQRVSRDNEKINVSCNFVVADDLPPEHVQNVCEMLANPGAHPDKCAAYISPLTGRCTRRRTLDNLYKIKRSARIPVYLYLVQQI